jgi:hypothetical protein
MPWKKIALIATASSVIIAGVIGGLIWLRNRNVGPEVALGKPAASAPTNKNPKAALQDSLTPQEQKIRDQNAANGEKIPPVISSTWSEATKQAMQKLDGSKQRITQ